jgi:hypothetical protein
MPFTDKAVESVEASLSDGDRILICRHEFVFEIEPRESRRRHS